MSKMTASKIVERALQISDLVNTDFLTWQEKTSYLQEGFHWVCQAIVNANLNLFTNKAQLVGANGSYSLPFDFWQMKSVKNPYSGQQILRKADSFSKYSSGYEIINNRLVIDGINPGPIEITYYRKPFYLSIPNVTIEGIDVPNIIDTSENNILYEKNESLYVWTPKGDLVTNITIDEEQEAKFHLVKDEFVIKETENEVQLLNFEGDVVWSSNKIPNFYYKSDDGLVYFGYKKVNDVEIYKLDEKITTLPGKPNYIRIGEEFYSVPKNSFPIGYFDDRPAYTLDGVLHLINTDGTEIEEPLDLPIMKIDGQIKYGIISNGKIYSNIPDTELNMPNNILYDLIAFRVAVYFLCKQNAESSGVENMYKAMEQQFFQSLDMHAGYPRLSNCR